MQSGTCIQGMDKELYPTKYSAMQLIIHPCAGYLIVQHKQQPAIWGINK